MLSDAAGTEEAYVGPHLRTPCPGRPDRRHHRCLCIPQPAPAGAARPGDEHAPVREALGCAVRWTHLSLPAAPTDPERGGPADTLPARPGGIHLRLCL